MRCCKFLKWVGIGDFLFFIPSLPVLKMVGVETSKDFLAFKKTNTASFFFCQIIFLRAFKVSAITEIVEI